MGSVYNSPCQKPSQCVYRKMENRIDAQVTQPGLIIGRGLSGDKFPLDDRFLVDTTLAIVVSV